MGRAAPLVSVMVPTYNHERYLGECLESILAQDYRPLQVVVSDDHSSDGTAKIMGRFAQRYPNEVVALYGRRRLGVTGNSNRALKACTGQLLALMAGDDLMLPGKIGAQVERMMEDPDCGLVYHDVLVFFEDSKREAYRWSSVRSNRPREGGAEVLIRHGSFVAGCSIMVWRKDVPPGGYDAALPVASDWLLWVETLHRAKKKMRYIDAVLAAHRRHGSNVTSRKCNFLELRRAVALAVERTGCGGSTAKLATGRVAYASGVAAFGVGDRKRARACFGEAFKCGWRRPASAAYWLRSLL